jgi:hypothetical protein
MGTLGSIKILLDRQRFEIDDQIRRLKERRNDTDYLY